MKLLSAENIILRALEPEDLEELYLWENDTSLWHLSSTTAPFSRYILKQYIESSHMDIYQTRQLRLIIAQKETKKIIGAIDIFDFDPVNLRAGIGILIGNKKDRMKGFASEALECLMNYCFATLHLEQLYCNILADNKESLSLFQKFGFKINGNKQRWIRIGDNFHDELFLQYFRE